MNFILTLIFVLCLAVSANAQGIDFLASTNSATASAKILLGRSAGAISGNVSLTLTNIPAYLVGSATVHVLAERIPDNGTAAVASEMTVINADYPVSANSITVTLASMGATEGYVVTLTPGTGGTPPSALSTTETLTINMALDGGPVTYKASGFLHQGFTSASPSDAFVTAVKPRLVRCGEVGTSFTSNICNDIYARATALGAKVQLLVSDNIYAAPWPGDGGNWTSWDNRCTSKANAAVTAGRTYQWDIWNEPNFPTFWNSAGGQAQFFETYRRCVNIIRSIIPGAVIVGPSAGPYDATWIQQFLTYAKANNVLPNILSWHEFDTTVARGNQIPTNIATMRAYLTANAMNDVSQIQINEMILEDEYYSPGKTIRYLANIERTEAVGAVHACWADAGTNTNDNCFNSPGNLNGLLTTAGTAARGSWWAYKAYGDMTGRLAGFAGIIPTPTIARTGSCAAAGTACTLSSVAAGDLVVSFAYRSGSATAPGAAANNTSIRTVSTSGGGGPASYRLSCRRASSAGDTGSGSYANATGVVSIAYAGTNVNSSADCQTSGIGARGATGNGVNWAKSSTTVSYQSLALTKIDGTVWVAGFMGGSASAVCSPASLTNRASAGVARVSDSNATVTSFLTGTCGVSSETWMSETLEILPLPAPPAGDTEAPSVPAGLNLATISSSQINASWSPSTDNVGVTEYRIERCQGVGCSTFVEVENPPSNSYSDTGLLASTSYSYRVRASDLVGNLSGYSATQTATTNAAPPSGSLTYTLDNFENGLRVGQPNSVGNLHNVWGFSCACTGSHQIVTSEHHDGTHALESYFQSSGDNDWQMHFYTFTETLPGWTDGWNLISRFANNPTLNPAGGTPAWITGRVNRIKFWIKMPPGVAQPSPAHHNVEFGTFIRCSTCGFAEDGGNHYYHFVTAYYAQGEWQQVIIDEHPDHQRGGFGNAEWGNPPATTPTSPGFTYYDLMTRFYIDMPYSPYLPKDSRVYVDGFELYEDTNPENTDQIRSLTAVYIPSTNETRVAWTRRKDQDTVNMEVRYAFSDIFALGFANATLAPSGNFTPPCCNGNNNVLYSSTAINVTGQSNLYFAVKPANSSLFRQIIIPVGPGGPAVPTNVMLGRRRQL